MSNAESNPLDYEIPGPREVDRRIVAAGIRCVAIVVATCGWMIVAMWVCQAIEGAEGLWGNSESRWDLYIGLVERWPVLLGTLGLLANGIWTLVVLLRYGKGEFFWCWLLVVLHIVGLAPPVLIAFFVTARALYP